MKLIQLNVWQNKLHKQLMNFLKEEQADIMCLQEICSSDITVPLFPGLRGFEAIKETFPGYHAYFSPCFESPMFGTTCRFGNAIFSRFPLVDTETIFINGAYQKSEMPDASITNIRNVQRATVRSEQGHFCLVNHHAYWVPSEVGNEISVAKMEKVADILKESPRPLIFSGDLNVTFKSPAMRPVHALLRDLTQEHDIPTTLSTVGKFPNIPCDHICVSEGVNVQNFAASEALVSDHKPLILEFSL